MEIAADDFCDRLIACQKTGDMTVADLQHWFERPYATVRTWVEHRRTPRGPSGREAERLLHLLEKAIAERRYFPVPALLSSIERPSYLKKVRHEQSTPIPASGAA